MTDFARNSVRPHLGLRMFVVAFALVLLALPLSARASPAFSDWAAVVVAGDDRAHNGAPSAIFDNARRGVVHDLEASGFSAANIAEFSVARHSGVPYARILSISDALRRLAQRARGGCLLYFSSHGAPDAMVLGNFWLTPRLLSGIIDGDCGNRPTVVVVSACFSGIFVPALAGKNRLILTAARRDRTSFGCGQTDRYPYFDECVLSVWPHVDGFVALGRAARICVAARERREHVGPPSEPQLRVGAAVVTALPAWRCPGAGVRDSSACSR
ncbi:MAG TPA: C13 family peptidase [Rhizomicrobium sp.]|nr:C13 family peptidase [Rhizomicrobium sp.]